MRRLTKYLIIIAAAAIFTGSIVIIKKNSIDAKRQNTFFLWYDGYVAAAKGEEIEIAFTFLTERKNIDHAISSISFDGNGIVSVEDFEITENDSKYQRYNFYGVVLKLSCNTAGEVDIDHISFAYNNGENETFQIGEWIFDVGAEDSGQIDTWESPAVSSSSEYFRYDYYSNDPAITFCKIYTSIESPINVEIGDTQEVSGKIDLSSSETSVKYIRSKITYTIGDVQNVSYGKGCYCGALDFDEEDIELSYQHNKQKS